ncbi:MAG TPA: hypothetical protein VLS49_15495 [Usitatibacter sp.]|nr:hypothetical protein [Usitatibacter sp.]
MNQAKMNAEVPVTGGGPRIGEEMKKMAAEPLLPIEKKLIGYSLTIGIVLLVVLWGVAQMFLKG